LGFEGFRGLEQVVARPGAFDDGEEELKALTAELAEKGGERRDFGGGCVVDGF